MGVYMSKYVYFVSKNNDIIIDINKYLANMGIMDSYYFTINDIGVTSISRDIYMEVGKKINSYIIDNIDMSDLFIIIDKKKMKIKKRNN